MSEKQRTPLVALSEDFLECLLRVPRAQQKKVQEFVKKFKVDPTSPGMNYEKIHQASDPNFRSVRIDQSWRAIVLKPDTGNVFVLLWMDTHDEAYQWASRRQCRIHPETGSLQILTLESQEASSPPATAPTPAPGLFDDFRDRELFKLGVPEALLPRIRRLTSMEALDEARPELPQEVWEALTFLASGEPYDEVFRALETRAELSQKVDTRDFATALENTVSRQRFVVVTDDLELQAILNKPLEKWRIFLHPLQQSLVGRDWSGPVRVLGGAGTGKTVVAMHRANYLASRIYTSPSDKILFTTFTRNLAADIAENLRALCSPPVYRRIEVVHLDKWVNDFLHRQGYSHRIAYFTPGGELEALWRSALEVRPTVPDLPDTFYREEWEEVIQAQGCTTLAEYLKARRTGRGVRLSFADRKAVWSVFELYRNQLDHKGLRESIDATRDARQLLEGGGVALPYQSLVVDEAQDMSAEAFRLLRQIVASPTGKNDLFIVGDGHQRIYQHKVVLSRAGILVRGRSRTLKINYRTTDEIRACAVRLLEGIPIDDLDGGLDSQKGYKALMHGEPPQVSVYPSFDAEVDAIAAYVKAGAEGAGGEQAEDERPESTCLVVRTQKKLEQYENGLRVRGVETYRIQRTEAEDRSRPGLRLATMHRVKGLEFDRMIIAALNEGLMPLTMGYIHSEDEVIREEGELRERALLYVALTRARREVLMTAHGTASKFLGGLKGPG